MLRVVLLHHSPLQVYHIVLARLLMHDLVISLGERNDRFIQLLTEITHLHSLTSVTKHHRESVRSSLC